MTDKQSLEIVKSYLVLNGSTWVVMHDIMIQPKGESTCVVEAVHMSGDRMGWQFISPERRMDLLKHTQEQINR